MIVYISKTAHTFTGIYDTLAEDSARPETDTIETSNYGGALEKFKPGEWHLTPEEAIQSALDKGKGIGQYCSTYRNPNLVDGWASFGSRMKDHLFKKDPLLNVRFSECGGYSTSIDGVYKPFPSDTPSACKKCLAKFNPALGIEPASSDAGGDTGESPARQGAPKTETP